jgi:hypothetical protein
MKRKKAGTTCYYEAQRSANNGLCCHILREESTEISFFEISFLTSNTVRCRCDAGAVSALIAHRWAQECRIQEWG